MDEEKPSQLFLTFVVPPPYLAFVCNDDMGWVLHEGFTIHLRMAVQCPPDMCSGSTQAPGVVQLANARAMMCAVGQCTRSGVCSEPAQEVVPQAPSVRACVHVWLRMRA